MTFVPGRDVALAPLTSLQLGGKARYFAAIHERAQLIEALRWAEQEELPVAILGGGSNLVISDGGFLGLVLHMQTRGLTLTAESHELVLLRAQAGEPWQAVVDCALDHDLAGVECLTGIPGSAGATPIQNVGAYGQEVGDTLREVEVLDRSTLTEHTLSRDDCQLAYRDSRLKREPERFVVLSVTFALRKHGAPTVRYGELSQALQSQPHPSLQQVAATVRQLRAAKSMLLDPHDENGRSAGSFFKNPIVPSSEADRVARTCVTLGLLRNTEELPRFAASEGQTKLSAGFLIERAGITKGLRRGAVGVSTKHALCLVHHGGGSTRELLALADQIRTAVRERFAIILELEPVCW